MPRRATWEPRIVSANDIIRGHVLCAAYTAKSSWPQIVSRWSRFLQLNGMTAESALIPWIGQMREAGLSPGTIHVYVQEVIEHTALRNNAEARSVLRACECYHTHKGGRGHARDIDVRTACKIFSQVLADSDGTAEAKILNDSLWLIVVGGLRPSCVARLSPDSVSITRQFLRVKIFLSKSDRKTRKRREIEVPRGGMPKPPIGFAKRQQNWRGKRLKVVTAAKLNDLLTRACSKLRIKRITCGSFRRMFARRMKDLGFDVSEKMAHVSSDMARAYYLM